MADLHELDPRPEQAFRKAQYAARAEFAQTLNQLWRAAFEGHMEWDAGAEQIAVAMKAFQEAVHVPPPMDRKE